MPITVDKRFYFNGVKTIVGAMLKIRMESKITKRVNE